MAYALCPPGVALYSPLPSTLPCIALHSPLPSSCLSQPNHTTMRAMSPVDLLGVSKLDMDNVFHSYTETHSRMLQTATAKKKVGALVGEGEVGGVSTFARTIDRVQFECCAETHCNHDRGEGRAVLRSDSHSGIEE